MANQRLLVAPLLSLVIAAPIIAQTSQPVAQNWTGWAQCQITIQAPGYSHRETHLWTITGAGTKNGNMEIYPTSWTVTGDGSLQRVNGPTTVSAQWTVNGTLPNVTIGTTLHLDRITVQRWTNHGPARSGLTGTEISTTNGVPRSRVVVLDVQQWAFPGVETGTTSTRATGSNTVPFDGLRGPMNPPSGAVGTAKCTWDFARGASTPTSPPVATTPTTPASGGSVSGGVPSGGGSGTGTGGAPGGAVTGSTSAGVSSQGGAGTVPSPGSTTAPTGVSADLDVAVVSSDPATSQPVSSWPAAGAGRYAITVKNNGPGNVSGALFAVSASAGLAYPWSMSGVCPPPTSCPGFGMPLLQGGVAIPSLPAGATFQLTLSGSVNGAVGTNVGVTATVTAPAGVTDPNPANNSASTTQSVVPSASATSGGGGSSGAGGGSTDLSSGVSLQAVPPFAAPANGKVVYDISIWNSGPSTANGAVLKISASAGPSNWSNFVCHTSQGPAPVPCPSGIAAGTIQSGLAIPSLPPNTGFKVWFDAAVPGTVGSNLSVTATITPPTGVTDTNPGNNSNTLTFPIVAPASSGAAGGGGGAGASGASAGSGAGGGGVNFRAFTTSGVFVVPAGVTTIGVELWGAGGGGAAGAKGYRGAFSGVNGGTGGGGGGGGAFVRTTVTVVPGGSYNVVVGAGGSAGGGNGGSSEVMHGSTVLASAAGGSGGSGPTGGAGGVSTSGASVIARNGLNGSNAGALPPPSGNCSGPPCQVSQGGGPGGAGGGSINGSVVPVGTTGGSGGNGGAASIFFVTTTQSQTNFGTGGTGTPGAPGYVLITW